MGAGRDAAPGRQGVESEKMRTLEEFDRGMAELERRMSEPTPRNLAKAKIYNARTPIEIAEARKIIREWIDEHPEDRFEFGKYASDLRRKEIRLDAREGTDGESSPEQSS